ncbi:hypothetical protein Ahy_B06g083404 [Arachis hypogaea]|uniref:GRF-type domain-containing protein n=1 Tax=Arachis hypogaea TaxID=3818 RepID=A0A444YQ02_ARAHY|nr:hypothetical protein Ahy_B06g083404 [Arachis hypogaea]
MAAESSRSCRSRSSAQKRELVCGHGERLVLRISGTRNNLGRRFWGCVYFEIQEDCDFFRWTDPEAESEDPRVARMKRKVAALKEKVRDIEWKFKETGLAGWLELAAPFSFGAGGYCVRLLVGFLLGLGWRLPAAGLLGLVEDDVGLDLEWVELG